jgi:hypothetical protein
MRLVLTAVVALAAGCPQAPPAATEPLPTSLRATGLPALADTLLTFAPQYPLWTDGATKRRWIHIPEGAAIDASDPERWVFPAGTRLWKEFSFGGRRVETRYMELLEGGTWRYATYVWNADGSDATLAPPAGIPGLAVDGGRHVIPGQVDCLACHEGRAVPVLGFTALQLSPDRDPGAPHAAPRDPADVDLPALVDRGLLRGLPPPLLATPPRIAARSPVERAALGYLHGNCGGCHNPEGPLASVGLSLDGDPAAVRASVVGRASRFRLHDRPDAALRVAPGRAAASVIPLRMRSRDPLTQMPPIGTTRVDHQAVALIERWIDEELSANPEEK